MPQKTIFVDVRTEEEWNNVGHAECAVNYLIDKLSKHIENMILALKLFIPKLKSK